ncbi:RDD family protein [Alkalihalobacillus sp. MEB130]|uniref:RDD family protein n=1 Tax=Alkalihalobacillus sp. MEB130 TaxID=2976704 RepID=UPI0028DF8322|nr:RDD family protein [Alkalihalobacillus sp. MEB130]MDT8861201.1 RDD family protein [Alkalihalobacillus sp. MEB130]
MNDNPAGFWIRLGANIIDSVIVFVGLGFISLLLFGSFFVDSFTILDFISPLYYLLLPVFWYGYTLGKRAVGIRIARVDGYKVGIGTMLLRDVVAGFVYAITLGIGVIVSFFMVVFREDKRSIHDFIAGTYVTYNLPEEWDSK